MPSITTYITVKKFNRVKANLPPAIDGRIDNVLDDIVLYAQAMAPIRTGYLRSSIKRSKMGVIVGAPYGSYVEFGTSKMAAQPYLRPAMQTVLPTLPRYFTGMTRELLR